MEGRGATQQAARGRGAPAQGRGARAPSTAAPAAAAPAAGVIASRRVTPLTYRTPLTPLTRQQLLGETVIPRHNNPSPPQP